jgi:NAD(P)-dependent dehydrogenase (short-subunit alcohol dehydrogenase family)
VNPPVEQTITLVTGANKGLGLETVRRLRDAGHTVLLSAREGATTPW